MPSADTEQGAGVHSRVDRPSETPPTIEGNGKKGRKTRKSIKKLEELAPEADPDRPRSVRSLALTSDRLGLTATLDLAEIHGTTAIPVEYRKGRAKRCGDVAEPTDEMMEQPRLIPGPEPWPTDRVQIGLQVLLLEEAGYTVPEAYLYYAAERLKLRVAVDDALKRDALVELEAAKRTAEGHRPPPLVNDPRCPRCSLQPICLPDEINHQCVTSLTVAGQPVDERLTPRKLWPPRDDGIHVVLQLEGIRVGVRGQSVRILPGAPRRCRESVLRQASRIPQFLVASCSVPPSDGGSLKNRRTAIGADADTRGISIRGTMRLQLRGICLRELRGLIHAKPTSDGDRAAPRPSPRRLGLPLSNSMAPSMRANRASTERSRPTWPRL